MTTVGRLIDEARYLASVVAASADRIERKRRIPGDVIQPIIDAGFFRLLLPRSLGGFELTHPDFLQIVRIFAESDASMAWCINQNNVFSTNASRLPEEGAIKVWSNPETVVAAGTPIPGSGATAIPDGFRITGRWDFCSGIAHSNWVSARAVVATEDAESGRPRDFLMPKEAIEEIDQWYVGGLKGTGSFSFVANDVVVDPQMSCCPTDPPRENGPLYLIDTTPLFASGFANVALATSRAGLDFAIKLANRKMQQGANHVLSADQATHRSIGQAEAQWNASRAFLDEATQTMWHEATEHRELPISTRIKVRLASTHAIRTAAEIANSAYALCGSSAIFSANPIQRHFQDAHAIRQQIQGRPDHYDTVGQFYLGMEPKGIF